MSKLRVVAAALTIAIGYALVIAAIGVDYPLADGDGGVVTPGIVLAVIFRGAPNHHRYRRAVTNALITGGHRE